MSSEVVPVLTIAIPTFNRAGYLALNLGRLVEEFRTLQDGTVEVMVSDNHSTDETAAIVAKTIAAGLPVRYIRNAIDIGSDANIAQCFNEARGQYVQIMGDDDLYVKGTLQGLVNELQQREYGVYCLRPYGYEIDPDGEFPGGGGAPHYFQDVGKFFGAIGPLITFISACIINRRIQAEVDARQFCGSNLVQVNLVVNAALLCPHNAFSRAYLLACKRNNSGGYDFSEVFVERLGKILDRFRDTGLTAKDIRRFETRMLSSYHPFYLFRQRLARGGDLNATYLRFSTRFGSRLLFRFWVAPIILWPRPAALMWGGMTTVVGRLANGDLRRGIRFFSSRLKRKL